MARTPLQHSRMKSVGANSSAKRNLAVMISIRPAYGSTLSAKPHVARTSNQFLVILCGILRHCVHSQLLGLKALALYYMEQFHWPHVRPSKAEVEDGTLGHHRYHFGLLNSWVA